MGDTDTMALFDNTFMGYEDPRPSGARGLRRLLSRHPREADLTRRRFRPGPAQARLEDTEMSHVLGFNALLAEELDLIEELPHSLRGSGYEGAATACATLDLLTPGPARNLAGLLAGPAAGYRQSVYFGAGRARARLRLSPMWGMRAAHPLQRWFALDGYAFQRALTGADRLVGEQRAPRLGSGSERAIFDMGLGRLLWFHDCAVPDAVAERVTAFPANRRPDLWGGVGYAAAAVGGADAAGLERLVTYATLAGFQAHLAQGAAFAAAAMLAAGPLPERGAETVQALTGTDAEEAGAWPVAAAGLLGRDPHSAEDFRAWLAHTREAWLKR